MELNIYDIIKGPLVSDKAYKLNRTQNQLVLEVHVDSNKALIKEALEKLFDVKVDQVRTSIRKHANNRVASRRFKARPTMHKRKIAYVTLQEGHSIASLNLSEQVGVSPEDVNRNAVEAA
jgi:large subunit ribosomal protein L23